MIEEKYTDMSLTDEQASLLGFKSFSESEQYIQVKDVRYTLDEFNRIGDYLLGRNLSNDQQVVLDWLKEQVSIGSGIQYVLWEFTDNVYEEPAEYSVSEQTKAWLELTEQEQFQVLAAFAEWGNKSNE
ncbi:hypothetical protein P7H00_13035 [Enterococcus pseudoavium]|uniref:Uncharacterized protein n=1 Tax=Enterococcus pseudoavium TaxID=44007 RepID=A0AAE4KXM2_9ENTE|nr:hypothetical protein [Enterococcus pseudoavium]MDT2738035.1 hypothetical protein [Enterococcus pseudoavium]